MIKKWAWITMLVTVFGLSVGFLAQGTSGPRPGIAFVAADGSACRYDSGIVCSIDQGGQRF